MVVAPVRELVRVLHEGVADRRGERGQGGQGAGRLEQRVVHHVQVGEGQPHAAQAELEHRVDFADGGGLHLSRRQSHVEVLLQGERRRNAHVADVETGVDQQQVPGHQGS